ncbi:MAG: hypothetical protein WBP13_08440 [Methylophilaceae bacterium]
MKRIPSHWIGLGDQVLVSGSNFLIGIILARVFGVQVFGLYVIATTFLLYANTFQSSLVVSPMMTAVPHELDEVRRQELLSGFFGYALILSLLTVMGIALVSYVLGEVLPNLRLGDNFWPLLLAILGFQPQDWLRRALYAQQKMASVLLLDFLAYGMQLLSLVILYFQQALTPATALSSMGAVFFLSTILMLFSNRIKPSYKQAVDVVKTHWRGSRDYFLAWQLQWAGSQGVILVGGGALGQEVIGAIRAIQNLTGPLNIIFQWMDNVIPVRAVGHLKKSGLPAMFKFLGRIGKIGGLILGVTVIALYFFAEPLVVFLYGESYRPYAFFAVLQGIYFLQGHFYRLELFACRASENSVDVARASLIVAIVSIIITFVAIHPLGGAGILWAAILGQTSSYIYLLYRRKLADKQRRLF